MSLSFKILRLFLVLVFLCSGFLLISSPVMSGRGEEYVVFDAQENVIGHTYVPQSMAWVPYANIIFFLLSGISLIILQHLGKRLSILEREVERLKDASRP
ncbi:hypothetical protein [Ruficoccus sp. ZRK36]|uniref:hypothetical protein n=1 Tax=Ruficoccus sp. ZRK36 TaxID=2866311 RepID=UPI001C737D47|nr:hypothetical protein [Ruficoccus sp. ZRK36]QYY35902.1 hypothetical protein K0V07_00165 [Ruficoccus sp. ZRK36]